MGERLNPSVCKTDAPWGYVGSNPTLSTILCALLAELADAADSKPAIARCGGSTPSRSTKFNCNLVQLVGRGTVNAYGLGSSPRVTAILLSLSSTAERQPYKLQALDWCAIQVRIL